MSTATVLAIALIVIGAACFVFILARLSFFSQALRDNLVTLGWGEKSRPCRQ